MLFTLHIECWSDYLHLILFSWWIQSDSCSGWAWQNSTIRLGLSDYWKHWDKSESQINFRLKGTSGRHPAQPSAQSKAIFNFRFGFSGCRLVKFCQNSSMKILPSFWALLQYLTILMENYFLSNPDDNQSGFEILALHWGWWASQFLSHHAVHTYSPCLLGLTIRIQWETMTKILLKLWYTTFIALALFATETVQSYHRKQPCQSGIICPFYIHDRCPQSVHHVPRSCFSKDITFHGVKMRLFGLLSFLPLLKMGETFTFFQSSCLLFLFWNAFLSPRSEEFWRALSSSLHPASICKLVL